MQITDVRIKLDNTGDSKMLAFITIVFDESFVLRDLKIIEGERGPFVAMPSRKLSLRCRCGVKNHLRAVFCNDCGKKIRVPHKATGHASDQSDPDQPIKHSKLYADIGHPITTEFRVYMSEAILRAYELELEAAKKPGYVSRYEEF